MADFIFIRKSRDRLSTVLHFLLNLALGVGSVFITYLTGSWIIGILLVVLSKWRIFAVRARYIFPNLKANLVDLIVGLSIVLITYALGSILTPAHFVLAAAYSIWLIFIKPGSSNFMVNLQALMAVFLGSTAVTLLFATINPALIVACEFIIGYAAARHIITGSDETRYRFLALSAALLTAEISLLLATWLIRYSFGPTGIIIPQSAIILTLFHFALISLYRSIAKHDGKVKAKEVAAPVIFSVLTIATIFLFFSQPIFNI